MEEQGRKRRGPMNAGSTLSAVRRLNAGSHRRVSVVVISSLLSGFAQAAVLVSLVNLGVGLAAGDEVLEGSFGPVGGFSTSTGTLLVVAVVLVVVVLVLDVVAAVMAARMSVDVMARERTAAYRAYADATWSVQATERDGHLQELLSKNAGWTGTAVTSSTTLIVSLCSLVALGLSAVLVEPLIAVAFCAGLGLLMLVARPMLGAVRRRTAIVAGLNVDFANTIARNVGLAQDIRTLDVGAEVRSEVEVDIHELSDRWFRIRMLNRVSPAIFRNAALLLLIAAVGLIHLSGREDLAAMGAVVVIVLRAVGYASAVQRSLQELNNAMPWLDQLWARTQHFVENRTDIGSRPLPAIESLRFQAVDFGYEAQPAETRVLRGLEFSVERGEAIGVVGPSGAGKSTLVKLLLRLHDPSAGAIVVNGSSTTEFVLSDWYRRVSHVPQTIVTFNGTIRENIAFFRPWVTDAAVEAAARRAHLHDQIMAMPHGYQTPVGERAGRLSGGQRQRLALARALVSNPDVLVLDEPTSALDMASESLVQQTLDELRGTTTLFIVAHRISTVASCERIMVLEDGELTALDTPERVRETNEFFRDANRLARL